MCRLQLSGSIVRCILPSPRGNYQFYLGEVMKSKTSGKHGVNKCKCPQCLVKKRQKKRQSKEKTRELRMRDYGWCPARFVDGDSARPAMNLTENTTILKGIYPEGDSLHKRCARWLIQNRASLRNPTKIWTVNNLGADWDYYMSLGGEEKFLFHGTKIQFLTSITKKSMVASTNGMLGPGVYLAPAIQKALMFGEWVLVCAVKPGRVHNMTQIHQLGKGNYDTSYAPAGDNGIAFGGALTHAEYCVKNDRRVLPLYVLEFNFRSYFR